MGIGAAEVVIVLVIVLILFAPTLIAFWIGYTLGTKRSVGKAPHSDDSGSPQPPVKAPEEREE